MRYILRGLPLLALLPFSACADWVTDILPYGEVEVQTTRTNGDAVPGTQVILYIGAQNRGIGYTDSLGLHRFRFLPPNLYGVYAEPPAGYIRPEVLLGGHTTAFVDDIRLGAGERKVITFTYLKEGPGRITVAVREPDGSAVKDTEVLLYSPKGVHAVTRMGDQTQVIFEPVPFGMWGVRVVPPEIYLEEGQRDFVKDGLLVEQGSSRNADFILEKCLGDLMARVRTSLGQPVAGLSVRLYRPTGPVEEKTTDSTGEATFGPLFCRTFGLAVLPKLGWEFEEGYGKSYWDGLRVQRGVRRTVNFTVDPCAGVIESRVRDEMGNAVKGARMALYVPEGEIRTGETDESGVQRFTDIPCGREYGVRITPPSGYSVEEGRGKSFFDGLKPRGPVPTVLEFRLKKS